MCIRDRDVTTMSRALDRLESEGYLERRQNPQCRRSYQLSLIHIWIVAMNNPSLYGDLYVTVQIQVPTDLSPDDRRKLKEFEAVYSQQKGGRTHAA